MPTKKRNFPLAYIGMVFECQLSGQPRVHVTHHEAFIQEFCDNAGVHQELILFLCSGPDAAGVTAVVNAVRQVLVDSQAATLPTVVRAQQPGEQYVYGYFQTKLKGPSNPSWKQAFYIGKGTVNRADGMHGGRWTSHVGDACGGGLLPRHKTIRAYLPSLTSVGTARQWAVQNGLVKKLYGFNGPYAEECAFAVEYFLVSSIYGAYAIDNDTNGNQKSGGYWCLARNHYYDNKNSKHCFIWKEAVQGFLSGPDNPVNKNTWWPALQTFYADKICNALDPSLQAVGLYPVQCVSEGRLRDPQALLRSNLNVTGSADCIITFTTMPVRPYRIDLRLSATRNELTINLRPSTHVMSPRLAHDQFTSYLGNHVFGASLTTVQNRIRVGQMMDHYSGVDPIRNRKQWPFYKPYASNGDGRQAVWFPMEWIPAYPLAIKFPLADFNGVRWLDPQHGQMSLIEALKIILLAWR